MIGIKINSSYRNSVITRKPVDSIRSSFKSTQLSILNHHHQIKPQTQKTSLSIQGSLKINISQNKNISTKVRTIQNSRKTPSAFSKVKRVGSFGGMNDHFLFQRKENHLNTCFNIRKNKLQEITKVNKQIYKRLNSQKSLYSNEDLNKSYQSIKVIKERLSQSKVSQRSSLSRQSSRSSLRNSKSMRGIHFEKNKEQPITVKAQNIHQAETKDLDKFRILFEKNMNARSSQTISKEDSKLQQDHSKRKNQAYIRSIKVSARMSIQGTKEIKSTAGQEVGGLLHRIMEDWEQSKENTCKKVK